MKLPNLLAFALVMACFLVALVLGEAEALRPKPLLHAESRAAHPTRPATTDSQLRRAIAALSPDVERAVNVLEQRRGTAFTDDELLAVLRLPEMEQEIGRQRALFCAEPTHAQSLACSRDVAARRLPGPEGN